MFTNPKEEGSKPLSAETFIGPSVKLEGNFAGDGDVVIEGMLIGNLTTKGDVRVGSGAVIEAQLIAKNADVAGKVKGNIVSNLLRLASTAIVHGDIKTISLSVEEGATINGKIHMSRDKTGKESEPIQAEPEKTKTGKEKLSATDKTR